MNKQVHISQMEMTIAICKEIERQCPGIPAIPKMMNACIETANAVKHKLDGLEYQAVTNDEKEN